MCLTSCSRVLEDLYKDMIYKHRNTHTHSIVDSLVSTFTEDQSIRSIFALNYETHPAAQTSISWCQPPPSCTLSSINCLFLTDFILLFSLHQKQKTLPTFQTVSTKSSSSKEIKEAWKESQLRRLQICDN